MSMDTINKLETGLDSRFIRLTGNRSSITNTTAGDFISTWRSTGIPGQGAIPTTAAVLNSATTGARGQVNPTGTDKLYFGSFEISCATAGTTVEWHDRLVHSGGLSGTVITAQTAAAFDLNTLLATNNLAERIGDANYSDVQWWLEIYTDVGGTGTTATVNVTYNDGTTGNLTGFVFGNTVRRAGKMVSLNNLIPAADSGKYIRGINSVQLSASTGTAGNFGFTATRYRGSVYCPTANGRFIATWADVGMPEIHNSSCLFAAVMAGSTTTGIITATGKILHG